MIINTKEINDYIKNENKTGYRIGRETGMNEQLAYSYKSGKADISNMKLFMAEKIQKVINAEKEKNNV